MVLTVLSAALAGAASVFVPYFAALYFYRRERQRIIRESLAAFDAEFGTDAR